jgi:hypothetical protein
MTIQASNAICVRKGRGDPSRVPPKRNISPKRNFAETKWRNRDLFRRNFAETKLQNIYFAEILPK